MSSSFRSSRLLPGASVACLPLIVAALLGSILAPVHAQQSKTAAAGVYSDQQAKRGEALYKDRCASCHGATLAGDVGPPLAGDAFVGAWGAPLSELVNKIQSTMPANDPGTLTRQQSTDVVAYLLQVGRFPAGASELSSDEAALKQIALP